MGAHLRVWGSFPHILLHSRKHEMWLPSSFLAHTFANPCLGREPKARVMTSKFEIWKFHKELSAKNLCSALVLISKFCAWKLPHLPNAISLHLVSNFQRQKLEAKCNFFTLALPWTFEFKAWKFQEGPMQIFLHSTSNF
jgi:hypothetical protein